jgi:hypothetical protein
MDTPGVPSVDELRERLYSDERLRSLFDEAVDASARATTEEQARIVGRALASGAMAADDAAVDEKRPFSGEPGECSSVDVGPSELAVARPFGARSGHGAVRSSRVRRDERTVAPGWQVDTSLAASDVHVVARRGSRSAVPASLECRSGR